MIFHAFVMRVIFDAGLLGLALAFGVIIYAMRKSGVSWLLTLCITAIALANGLSVSGPNNPWVAIVVLVAILLAGNSQRALEAKKNSPDFESQSG